MLVFFVLWLNYFYKDKILIILLNCWDGFFFFLEDNCWDNFLFGVIVWNISEEDFLVNSLVIFFLKLCVSYGFMGNNIIVFYFMVNSLDQQMYYDYYGIIVNGWLLSVLVNIVLGWEKICEVNFGIDFGFVKECIIGSIDVYDCFFDDLFLEQCLLVEFGFEFINVNVGLVSNKGVEIVLIICNIKKKNFFWEMIFIFICNCNEIVFIYGQDEVDDVGNSWFIGEFINLYYNYVFDGIWQVNQCDEVVFYGQLEG